MAATHVAELGAGLIDKAIMTIAARSHGACTHGELLSVGVKSRAIERRVQSGALVTAQRGVYIVGPLVSEWTEVAVAIKAVAGSAAARTTAALFHEFSWERWLKRQGLHIVGRNGAHLSGSPVIVHQTRHLPGHHIVTRNGLPVTSAARTICDLAPSLSIRRLAEFIERELAGQAVDLNALLSCHIELARSGRRGTMALRQVLCTLADDRPFPQSVLELAVQERLVREALPMLRQYRPPWYDGLRGVVDFGDPASRTILEADGRSFHSTMKAFADDRRRDRTAVSHGWAVLRVSWQDATGDGSAMDDVISIVRRRRLSTAS
jgi:very-short-patch-repair endonuclease